VFVVHENHRYRPWFQDALEQYRSGVLGPVRFVRLEQHDSHEPPETFKVASERGVLLEYGVHMIAILAAAFSWT
jgi:predicted dehydrogenase